MASRYGGRRYPRPPEPEPELEEDDEPTEVEVVLADEENEEEEDVWPQGRLAPRSLVRRPPGGYSAQLPVPTGSGSGRAVRTIPQGQRQVVLHHGLPRRASQPPSAPTSAAGRGFASAARPQQTRRMHWLFWVGLGMLALLAGYVLLTTISTWWQVQQDNWRYGNPRTFQTDAVVGHGPGKSHFIVVNLDGQVEIIECPAQDCTKAVIYPGPRLLGSGAALIPVTISFEDVNGDGKPDMLVHVEGQTFVWLNTGKQFRPATSSDHVSLPTP
jgi:hypothetical protein